jgi:hypothetical protein
MNSLSAPLAEKGSGLRRLEANCSAIAAFTVCCRLASNAVRSAERDGRENSGSGGAPPHCQKRTHGALASKTES